MTKMWRFHTKHRITPLPSLQSEAIHTKINPCVARTASRSASWCIKREKRKQECLRSFYARSGIKRGSPLKALPKAYEHSEVKTAAAFLCVGERGGGAALFAKKCDLINDNIFAEFRRSEKVENAESTSKSLKDSSDSTNSSDLKNGLPRQAYSLSRNDEFFAIPRKIPQNLAMIF